MDGCLEDFLTQVAVVEAGQRLLLRGVDDDDGVGSLPPATLSVLGALGDVGFAQSGQLFLLVHPHYGIVGGGGQCVAPLRLQFRDAQVNLLHAGHLVLRQQGTLAHEALVGFLQQFLVFARQRCVVAVVDLPDALEQLLIERDVVFQFRQHGHYLLLCLAQFGCLVSF